MGGSDFRSAFDLRVRNLLKAFHHCARVLLRLSKGTGLPALALFSGIAGFKLRRALAQGRIAGRLMVKILSFPGIAFLQIVRVLLGCGSIPRFLRAVSQASSLFLHFVCAGMDFSSLRPMEKTPRNIHFRLFNLRPVFAAFCDGAVFSAFFSCAEALLFRVRFSAAPAPP